MTAPPQNDMPESSIKSSRILHRFYCQHDVIRKPAIVPYFSQCLSVSFLAFTYSSAHCLPTKSPILRANASIPESAENHICVNDNQWATPLYGQSAMAKLWGTNVRMRSGLSKYVDQGATHLESQLIIKNYGFRSCTSAIVMIGRLDGWAIYGLPPGI